MRRTFRGAGCICLGGVLTARRYVRPRVCVCRRTARGRASFSGESPAYCCFYRVIANSLGQIILPSHEGSHKFASVLVGPLRMQYF